LLNVVNVAIAPPLPTVDNLQPTIDFATATVRNSVAESGPSESNIVVTLLQTLDYAGDLAGYVALQRQPAVWFGSIQVIMNGLTDAQRTIINSLDIGSQVSVTKSFPNSTPSTVTQLMALEGISHDITPDRHIVTLYPNPARIYTYFIVGGYTTTTTRTNLVTNPSFEVNTTGWTTTGGSSLARSTSYQVSGVASALSTSTVTDYNGMTLTTRINVNPSTPYYLSAYCRNISGSTRLIYLGIQWFTSGGAYISEVNSGSQGNLAVADGWVRRTATGTSPANAASAQIFLLNGTTGLSAGWQSAFDAILFEQTSTLLPYFDGTYADTYTGYTLTAQGWSGTADASTSTATWGLTSSFVGSELNDDTKGLG
jgi:hypothetical protein